MTLEIRPEHPGDHAAIRDVTAAAFAGSELGHHGEAELIERLRASETPLLSLVAVRDGQVIGHVLFSPAHLETASGKLEGSGLAPVSVAPGHQRTGVGTALIREGLAQLERDGCPFVVVLGHPDYYARFGFEPAADSNIHCEFPGVGREFFRLLCFDPHAARPGVVHYHPEFSRLE